MSSIPEYNYTLCTPDNIIASNDLCSPRPLWSLLLQCKILWPVGSEKLTTFPILMCSKLPERHHPIARSHRNFTGLTHITLTVMIWSVVQVNISFAILPRHVKQRLQRWEIGQCHHDMRWIYMVFCWEREERASQKCTVCRKKTILQDAVEEGKFWQSTSRLSTVIGRRVAQAGILKWR